MFKKETFKEMLCPVCKDFYFTALREDNGEDLSYLVGTHGSQPIARTE